jgi:hypothetical protein
MIARRTLLQAVSGLVAAMLAEAQAFDRRAAAAVTPKLETLTQEQARIVAAIGERIWPGAEAAGAITYIDRALATAYRTDARLYRMALPRLDAAAQQKLGRQFSQVDGEQQDMILADLEAGRLKELPGMRGMALFNVLRKHVIEGVLSDPIHGGNRDFAGWKAVGYPGPYRLHPEEDQTSVAPLNMPYQSIKDL